MTVENVFIFVADALREDHLPEGVDEVGEYVPTIAASTNTPSAFSSIVSGLYPTQHGTFSFSHRLQPEYNVLNHLQDEYNTAFYQYGDTAAIADVLGIDCRSTNPLSDIEPPFVVLERELNTHAPYGQFHDEAEGYEHTDDYFEGGVVDFDLVKEEYKSGCELAEQRFLNRLEELDARGLLEDTLVIFTSDHGELLGEYGEYSHGDPVVPELVKVPTVIKHPEQGGSDSNLMSHVDILPTIQKSIDVDIPWNCAGESIYDGQTSLKVSEFVSKPHILDEFSLQDYYEYQVRSVWDENGGRLLNFTSASGRLLHAIRQIGLFNPRRGRDALRSFGALHHQLATERVIGEPGFSKTDAEAVLRRIDDMDIELRSSREGASEGTKEHLERLGYRN